MGRWFSNWIIHNWFARHAQRGATVPFEAPALRMARVCDDERDGLIAVLRDFANNGAAYIVPWRSLPLMAAMTDHDMAIHGAISETKACSPAQVRDVIGKLALSGALGPEAKAQEGRRAAAESGSLADVETILIVHLLTSCDAGAAPRSARPACWNDADARAAVTAAASVVGASRREIYRRIGEFTRLLAPVGLGCARRVPSGWLRVLCDEVASFGQTLAAGGQVKSAEVGPFVTRIAAAATRTARLSGLVFEMLDYAVLDIVATIRRWDAEAPVLRQSIEQLSLMLDEWPALMKMTRDALRAPTEAAAAQLRMLRSTLPPVSDAVGGDDPPDRPRDAPSASDLLGARLAAIGSILGATQSVDA